MTKETWQTLRQQWYDFCLGIKEMTDMPELKEYTTNKGISDALTIRRYLDREAVRFTWSA